MNNIEKLATEIMKEAIDQIVKNRLKLLWGDLTSKRITNEQFSKNVGETLKRNRILFSEKSLIERVLKNLTGQEWKLSPEDFARA